jgi:shikimate dehydrogenase
VALLDELTPEARLVGAVNVIRRDAASRLAGTALDGEGFVAGLRACGHEVEGKRCLLAGAGEPHRQLHSLSPAMARSR